MERAEIDLINGYESGRIKGSIDHIQYFVITMGYIEKNQGKRSFWGADKGTKYFEKFCDLLIPQLALMIKEGIISRRDDPRDICEKLYMMIHVFIKAFPMWEHNFPLTRSIIYEQKNSAALFAQLFFQEQKSMACTIIQH